MLGWIYSISRAVAGKQKLESCEWDDIGVDEENEEPIIDEASFRFEYLEIRIWESPRPQTNGIMVDVLENGKDTGGGSLNMHESSQTNES